MDFMSEVFIVTDASKQGDTFTFYDLKKGALEFSFKDKNPSSCAKNTLSFIKQDFVILAESNKPEMKICPLVRNNTEVLKFIAPGHVSSLAVSDCGMYCAAGIDKLLYMWQVTSGSLLSVVQSHADTITCVKYSSDGSHLITSDKDGIVLVWLVYQVISSSDTSENIKPRYHWMHHSAEVTDIYSGNLGVYSRVVTASKDMTCRIYELDTGNLLTTVHVDHVLTAVTMDACDSFLFLGTFEGYVFRINMFASKKSEIEYKPSDSPSSYEGHSKGITSLSVSPSAKYLLSGSEDCTCRIWDLLQFTCIRVLKLNGAVTNAFATTMPPGLLEDSQYVPRLNVSSFKRNYDQDEGENEFVTTTIEDKELSLMHVGAPDYYFNHYLLNCSTETLASLNRSSVSMKKMMAINNQMYAFSMALLSMQTQAGSVSINSESD